MAGARQIVDPPSFTPSPYGLLSAVDEVPTTDAHWQNGVTYQPVCSTPSSTYEECLAITGTGGPPSPPAFTSTTTVAPRGATSFEVIVGFDCSAVGNASARETAVAAFASSETWQAERSFWTGIAGGQAVVWPHLAANAQVVDKDGIVIQTAAVTVTGVGDTLKSPAETLGLLEGALADCYNGIGVIHIPAFAAQTFQPYLTVRNGKLFTANGNKVALGNGYPGTSPAGAARAVDTTWIYATGNVFMYRGAAGVTEDLAGFDRAKNTRRMIGQRVYLFGWDCCLLAINAALGAPKGT